MEARFHFSYAETPYYPAMPKHPKGATRAMGKFKIHLKLQGLELDIEGDRSDMPAINNAVANSS